MARPVADPHAKGLSLALIRTKVPQSIGDFVRSPLFARYKSLGVETVGYAIPGVRTMGDLPDLSASSYDAAWERLGHVAETTGDRDPGDIIPALCPRPWLEYLYAKVKLDLVAGGIETNVYEKHRTCVAFLATRAYVVKGVKVESLATEKEAEKLAYGFGLTSVSPTGFYTEGLAFVQGALAVRRSDLVASGNALASLVSRLGAVVQSDVLLTMAAIEQHSYAQLVASAKDHESRVLALGESIGLSSGASLFEKVETIAKGCDKKLLVKSTMYRDFAGLYDPPIPALLPFGEKSSRLTPFGQGDKKRHIHICRSMNAIAALVRNTKLSDKLADVYAAVARAYVNDDPALFDALAANAATKTDCHPKLAAILSEVSPDVRSAAASKPLSAPRPLRLASRRS